MGNLSKSFDSSEFRCRCGCGLDRVSRELISRLQRMRDIMNRPLVISSGCRCLKHNLAIGGEFKSAHLPNENGECEAADILIKDSTERYEFIQWAYHYFERIGLYLSQPIVHVDVAKHLPQRVLWVNR